MAKQVQKSGNKKLLWFGLAVLVVIGFGGGYLLSSYLGSGDERNITDISAMRGGETRPTLSPARFSGKTALTYEIAREIPEILDSLHCYCECKKHFGHKSLLTCYVDDHAAFCDVCMDEAIRAYELFKQGKDILAIRKTIDKEFSR
ncbi:MAG: hypothetical protein HZB80_04605 [Deltaproteobacteria bacterium]|nr:hypothetical protein [Deltaproteobacteria bacterium]